jgi:hypothetical protein
MPCLGEAAPLQDQKQWALRAQELASGWAPGPPQSAVWAQGAVRCSRQLPRVAHSSMTHPRRRSRPES